MKYSLVKLIPNCNMTEYACLTTDQISESVLRQMSEGAFMQSEH